MKEWEKKSTSHRMKNKMHWNICQSIVERFSFRHFQSKSSGTITILFLFFFMCNSVMYLSNFSYVTNQFILFLLWLCKMWFRQFLFDFRWLSLNRIHIHSFTHANSPNLLDQKFWGKKLLRFNVNKSHWKLAKKKTIS